MLNGNNGSNTSAPPFLDTRFQYPLALSNQPRLGGNIPVEFHADPVNYHGRNNNVSPSLPPNKRSNNIEVIPTQNFQFSFNNKVCDESDQKAIFLNQNPVSTGLKLSYDDNEKNSSISSASGSMTAASSIISDLSNEMKRDLDRQEQELSHLIRTQEENMVKGLKDITQRHTSFLTVLEQKVTKKLHEKNLELETIGRRNKELVENVKKVSSDAQNWCYMAKYNESVVNYLKNNLQQAMEGSNRVREGFGENDTDDAASSVDPNNYLAGGSHRSKSKDMSCRSCKRKEVCVVLMPCRHLCVCKDCEGFASVCPVCKMIATASFEVYLS